MSKRSFSLFGLMLAGMFILAACADTAQPTATPNSFNPTPAGQQSATSTPSNTTTAPEPTKAPAAADPTAGQSTFATNCSACHNTNDQRLVGPGLAGVGDRAASRVPGESADDYLHNSIKNPGDFIVDGFGPIMPALPLSDSEIDNLVAYLKTLK